MKTKNWKRDCKVDIDIEIVYSGAFPIKLIVHKLKVEEVDANKNRKVLTGSIPQGLEMESRKK